MYFLGCSTLRGKERRSPSSLSHFFFRRRCRPREEKNTLTKTSLQSEHTPLLIKSIAENKETTFTLPQHAETTFTRLSVIASVDVRTDGNNGEWGMPL